ncbi:hypothetical protein J3Q64DRAFT_1732553 [Phycomyces blakesleeanus]|uniref:C3H1-type domain-containing protein n=1 Tax=Phycomyces blakesleeanus TaxID=4837 RepID=A0ABR3B4U5_PHYBL
MVHSTNQHMPGHGTTLETRQTLNAFHTQSQQQSQLLKASLTDRTGDLSLPQESPNKKRKKETAKNYFKNKKNNNDKKKALQNVNQQKTHRINRHNDDCKEKETKIRGAGAGAGAGDDDGCENDECDFDELMALYESAGSRTNKAIKLPGSKPKKKQKAKALPLPVETTAAIAHISASTVGATTTVKSGGADAINSNNNKSIESTSNKKTQLPCRYWIHGRCQQGDTCPFLHEGEPLVTVCRFFKTNSCYNGESCPFSHDLKLEPCRFFHLKGVCENGIGCPFSHEPLTRDFRRRLHLSTGPCRFFHFKGFCNDGEECLFSHEPIKEAQLAELESTLELCKHYHLSGTCKQGDNCFFLHDEASESAVQKFLEKNKANKNINVNEN